MRKKSLKYILILCGIALLGMPIKQFCYRKTDGFALYKIQSSLRFNPEWETSSPSIQEQEALLKTFDQPFYYLSRGAQSFVFASADQKTVIKFFRIYHLRPPQWLTFLTPPIPWMPYKIRKILDKNQELNKDFQSYKIAFQEMKDETGLLYLHLNKTDHLKKHLLIYDKIGIAYQVDLDKMEFLVQKKASLVYPHIAHLMQTEGIDSAKGAISSLIKLLVCRNEKGIFDKDPDLSKNFGFLGHLPIQIDIGRFRMQEARASPEIYRDEIIRITDHFRQWLDNNYPPLSEHLQNEIQHLASS